MKYIFGFVFLQIVVKNQFRWAQGKFRVNSLYYVPKQSHKVHSVLLKMAKMWSVFASSVVYVKPIRSFSFYINITFTDIFSNHYNLTCLCTLVCCLVSHKRTCQQIASCVCAVQTSYSLYWKDRMSSYIYELIEILWWFCRWFDGKMRKLEHAIYSLSFQLCGKGKLYSYFLLIFYIFGFIKHREFIISPFRYFLVLFFPETREKTQTCLFRIVQTKFG